MKKLVMTSADLTGIYNTYIMARMEDANKYPNGEIIFKDSNGIEIVVKILFKRKEVSDFLTDKQREKHKERIKIINERDNKGQAQ